jgi:hypothetical protein
LQEEATQATTRIYEATMTTIYEATTFLAANAIYEVMIL